MATTIDLIPSSSSSSSSSPSSSSAGETETETETETNTNTRTRTRTRTGKSDYVELRCRSAFSFLDGASLPEELAAAAAAGGHDTLALADRDGVYGAPRFFGAARKAGLRPIVGAEISLAGAAPLLLLVEDRRGYQNLCQLITAAKVDSPGKLKSDPLDASTELLAAYAGGLIALAGAAPRADLPALTDVFGRDRVFLEVHRHFDADQAHRNRDVLAQAAALNVGVVATNDVRYATPAQRIVHDVLCCAREKATVDEIGRRLAPNAERWLKPPGEMSRCFAICPPPCAPRARSRSAARSRSPTSATSFPDYDVPAGETQQSFLEKLSWKDRTALRAPRSDPAKSAGSSRASWDHRPPGLPVTS
jgi:error-prone DNA polymerase